MLHLIDDLRLVSLRGLFERWLGEYGRIISIVRRFLFGWIPFHWVSVSNNEMHLMVLSGILVAAWMRVTLREAATIPKHLRRDPRSKTYVEAALTLTWAILAALLLPDGVSLPIMLLPVVPIFTFSFVYFRPGHSDYRMAFWMEILGVCGIVLVVLAINASLSGQNQ